MFDHVQDVQAIASSLTLNQPHSATICWSSDLEELQHEKYRLKISHLTEGVRKMLEDLLKQMHSLSGGNPVKYSIPEDHVDDLTSTARGNSWLDGCHTEPRDHALMHAMVKGGTWGLSTVNEDGGLAWNKVACEEFMDKAAEIVDKIITLVHLGSGPPLRGEELIRDQISNGIQPRTIYLVFGQIMAIRRHSKDTNLRGVDAFNVCYFPKSLTDAICYYLLVVRPLERLVAWQLYQDRKKCLDYNLYLYVKHGERMTSTGFSTTLSKLTRMYIGVKLSLNPLRHIMIAFQRAFVEPKMVDKGNNIGDLISSHTSKTANTIYAREQGCIEGATSGYLLDVQDWCELYHDAIGLGDRIGPLIPLRTKRKLARKLVAMASMDPTDPLAANVVADILKSLGETSYKAGLKELRSHVVQEIWNAVSSGLGRIVSDEGLFQGPPPSRPNLPTQPSHLPQNSAPTKISPPLGTQPRKPAKRQLSEKDEPAAKRKVADSGRTPLLRDPNSEGVVPDPADDPQLEYCGQDTDAVPNTPDRPIVPLPSRKQRDDAHELQTLQRMSALTIEPNSGPNQSSEDGPSFDRPRSSAAAEVEHPPNEEHSSDKLLNALKIYRGDPSAQFKSKEQRELVESVVAGRTTVAILPTGSGKSLAFELPPIFTGQVTIVGIPYKVIISQALQNSLDRGVDAKLWYLKTPRTIGETRLIIVPYDTLFNTTFLE